MVLVQDANQNITRELVLVVINCAKLNLLKEVKQEYYELLFINQSLEIITKNHSLLENFVKIASTRYSVGKGIQQDVIKSDIKTKNKTIE